MTLARQIGTPNIKSKGPLVPRTVQIPASLFPDRHPAPRKIVEVSAPARETAANPKGILKTGDAAQASRAANPASAAKRPELSWSKNALTEALTIHLAVPELVSPAPPYRSTYILTHTRLCQTRAAVTSATLDIEPRRLILSIPHCYALDLDLNAPDAAIRDALALSPHSTEQALMLKRQRDLDVDNARAEWRVAEGRLLIHV